MKAALYCMHFASQLSSHEPLYQAPCRETTVMAYQPNHLRYPATSTPLPQMEKILANLAELRSPWNCPHGRPTMRHLADLRAVRRMRSAVQPQ